MWQPIETAPKDRKYYLVWCPANRMTYEVCWNSDNFWDIIGGAALYEVPTHWLPLPEPPHE